MRDLQLNWWLIELQWFARPDSRSHQSSRFEKITLSDIWDPTKRSKLKAFNWMTIVSANCQVLKVDRIVKIGPQAIRTLMSSNFTEKKYHSKIKRSHPNENSAKIAVWVALAYNLTPSNAFTSSVVLYSFVSYIVSCSLVRIEPNLELYRIRVVGSFCSKNPMITLMHYRRSDCMKAGWYQHLSINASAKLHGSVLRLLRRSHNRPSLTYTDFTDKDIEILPDLRKWRPLGGINFPTALH